MISVVIPTYREADSLQRLLPSLSQDPWVSEIVVSDGGSADGTVEVARSLGAVVEQGPPGRGAQLNRGAQVCRQPWLYFLHADTRPPANFGEFIAKSGAQAGTFRARFDYDHHLLRLQAWCTRWNWTGFRYGDHSLFVQRQLFEQIGGYREEMKIFEDQEIVRRIKNYGSFRVLIPEVLTSARKYRLHGVYRTQAVYTLLLLLYQFGLGQNSLLRLYRNLLRGEPRLP